MKQEEAERLARDIKEQFPRLKDPLYVFELCDYVLSLGDMKREIENAAYERVIAVFLQHHAATQEQADFANAILREVRALIQPPAQKENRE